MRISTCTLAVLAAVWASASWAVVPNVSDSVIQSQNTILKDPKIQKIYQDLSSPESAKERFNTHMELVRIASPSREEFRRSAEIHKRLKTQWCFDDQDIMTQVDGYLKGAGIQTVDGKPVYNVCVRIPGTYSKQNASRHYKGQYPKILIEGHIDTVSSLAQIL